MKKNKSMSKFTAIVLLITMLTLIAIAGTYAKYTTAFTGEGTAKTASWDITLEPKESPNITVAEKNITINVGEKIYPGSSGKIGTLTVHNGSDTVNAEIKEVTISNLKINDEDVESALGERLTITSDYKSPVVINKSSSSDITFNYKWEWTGDVNETEYAGKDITFKVSIVVDQEHKEP